MANSPRFKVHDAKGVYQASCKEIEAAELVETLIAAPTVVEQETKIARLTHRSGPRALFAPLIAAARREGGERRIPQQVWARGGFAATGRVRIAWVGKLDDGRSWDLSAAAGAMRLTVRESKVEVK